MTLEGRWPCHHPVVSSLAYRPFLWLIVRLLVPRHRLIAVKSGFALLNLLLKDKRTIEPRLKEEQVMLVASALAFASHHVHLVLAVPAKRRGGLETVVVVLEWGLPADGIISTAFDGFRRDDGLGFRDDGDPLFEYFGTGGACSPFLTFLALVVELNCGALSRLDAKLMLSAGKISLGHLEIGLVRLLNHLLVFQVRLGLIVRLLLDLLPYFNDYATLLPINVVSGLWRHLLLLLQFTIRFGCMFQR